MSLQHEIIHGHPDALAPLNALIGQPGRSRCGCPTRSTAVTHLRHHNDSRLTDPLDDPESYYCTQGNGARSGRLGPGFSSARNRRCSAG